MFCLEIFLILCSFNNNLVSSSCPGHFPNIVSASFERPAWNPDRALPVSFVPRDHESQSWENPKTRLWFQAQLCSCFALRKVLSFLWAQRTQEGWEAKGPKMPPTPIWVVLLTWSKKVAASWCPRHQSGPGLGDPWALGPIPVLSLTDCSHRLPLPFSEHPFPHL